MTHIVLIERGLAPHFVIGYRPPRRESTMTTDKAAWYFVRTEDGGYMVRSPRTLRLSDNVIHSGTLEGVIRYVEAGPQT